MSLSTAAALDAAEGREHETQERATARAQRLAAAELVAARATEEAAAAAARAATAQTAALRAQAEASSSTSGLRRRSRRTRACGASIWTPNTGVASQAA